MTRCINPACGREMTRCDQPSITGAVIAQEHCTNPDCFMYMVTRDVGAHAAIGTRERASIRAVWAKQRADAKRREARRKSERLFG